MISNYVFDILMAESISHVISPCFGMHNGIFESTVLLSCFCPPQVWNWRAAGGSFGLGGLSEVENLLVQCHVCQHNENRFRYSNNFQFLNVFAASSDSVINKVGTEI